ncbi:telomeric repeat-binding factor 2-like isoform X1 [Archocentrus centrarchus]|uniref:telomeric repeat-binding factor 2-like isoform X1 n=2 Tax=Archocentrus centrarchus TaxID=63155 RepID=UPI0011EA0FAE|nr:telomeric repeat-binding factor 2-like isoform X1 [Archocentrus centrarchus]
MDMAAKEIVNSLQTESVVNRWLLDYYLFLALDFFRKEQYEDCCAITKVLDSVLARPYERTDLMSQKIQVWQFLSRINEGEKLDLSSQSVTPLESALILLENMIQKFSIPQQDYKNVCTSIKEMILMLFIKNGKFDKAEEALNKHFTKRMDGKRMLFMGLISKKNKKHEVIEQINFRQFKNEMLVFCESLCPVSSPFLEKAAKQLIEEKTKEQHNSGGRANEQAQPLPSSSPQVNAVQSVPCKHSTIQRTRLEVAYSALAAVLNERTFSQLEEEVETEDQEREDLYLHLSSDPKMDTNLDLEQEILFQRDSGSPMEVSPADQPPQTDVPQTQGSSLSKTTSVPWSRQLYTVSRLVMEPDSQANSQFSKVSEELDTEARLEEESQTLALSNKRDVQCPVTDQEVAIPIPQRRRRTNRTDSRNYKSKQLLSDSEEEPQRLSNPSMIIFPNLSPLHPVPQTSSTPHKDSTQLNSHSHSKCAFFQSPKDVKSEITDEELHDPSNTSSSRKSKTSKQLPSDSEEDPQEPVTLSKTPVQKPHEQLCSDSANNQVNPDVVDDFHITDSSMESSPVPSHPVPQTSSTPHKDSAQTVSSSKWKQLYNNAKESKDVWSNEELYFTSTKSNSNMSTASNSGHQKKKWTESETQKLKDGVRIFGEGNWTKIKAYYGFKDRTNINLKDRWRTMKKLNMV